MAVDVKKLMQIINQRAGEPQAPQNPMTGRDSLNVNLGLVHNYSQMLGKKIMSKNLQDQMAEADMEVEDKNFLSDSRKHAAALNLMDIMLQAKKENKPLSNYQLDPISGALFKGFIEKAANEAIANKKHGEYQKAGEGLNKK